MGASRERLLPGDRLGGRYRILRLLGRGGMGSVYLAEDVKLPGKLWAVKEMESYAQEPALQDSEARMLSECSHPGLAAVVDYFPAGDDGRVYLVMEYVEGETVEATLRRVGRYEWDSAARLGLELCATLRYLHEGRSVPIIHRDLKPSNLMLDRQGRLRLIDFGTARRFRPEASGDTVRLGTPGFAAPEQLAGRQSDARTDLYALGALLYYLLTGGELPPRTTGDQPILDRLSERAPPDFVDLLCRLLRTQPEERFQRASEAAEALRGCLARYGRSITGYASDLGGGSRLYATGVGVTGKQQRRIVIGGLTAGCGATFVTLALSGFWRLRGVPHAVVELPGTAPDLYHLLDGERNAPDGYRFAVERTLYGTGPEGTAAPSWQDAGTEWLPLPPGYLPEAGWSTVQTELLLSRLTAPAVLLDVGSRWQDEAVQALCREADAVLVVCGPSPTSLLRSEAGGAWRRLSELCSGTGTELLLVANRDCRFAGRQAWLQALPAKPAAYVPELPARELLKLQWLGKLPMDEPHLQERLARALSPFVRLAAAGERDGGSSGAGTGFWSRLFRK